MKPILVAALAALSLTTAQAVEYVTLTPSNPSKAVSPTDLVEVVGCSNIRTPNATNLVLTFNDGSLVRSNIGGSTTTNGPAVTVSLTLGNKYELP